jgi:perosamine synthetase
MFSLCQTKVFTTGEGGFITTNSKEIYEKLKLLRSHGRAETANYFTSGEHMDYITLGYNFRMPDIIAALGISQIKKVNKLIDLRRKHAKYMTDILSSTNNIIIPRFSSSIYHVYQEYYIRIKDGEMTRNLLKKYLAERGIGTRISFPPVHKSKFYKKLGYRENLKNTEFVSSYALTLPLYPSLNKNEIYYIVNQIKNFFKNNEK